MTEISLMEDPVYENDEFNLFKEAILKEPNFNYESGLDQHINDQMIYVASVDLTDVENEYDLRTEQPSDCAGSAKCETLGISLLDAIDSDDPTALVGLPLIRTSRLLREAGLNPLQAP